MPADATPPAPAGRTVACPQCGGPSLYAPSNPYRPFCSQRCQMIDLGAWGREEFRMPAEAPSEDTGFGDPKFLP